MENIGKWISGTAFCFFGFIAPLHTLIFCAVAAILIDFITGNLADYYRHKRTGRKYGFESEKAWKTIWKLGFVIIGIGFAWMIDEKVLPLAEALHEREDQARRRDRFQRKSRVRFVAKIEKLAPFILKWEGGFVDDPFDKGGATNKGITIGTFTAYRKSIGRTASVEELKNISDTEWAAIFKTLYWDRWRAGEINNQSVADILVDWVWASGAWGIKIPQRVLGVVQDGSVGPVTLAAVNAADAYRFFEQLKAERIRYVDGIIARDPSQKRYEKGWKNRINDIVFRYKQL